MGLPEKKYITVEEYLEAESKSLEKHEYYNGEIFAMAGATVEHNRIVSNSLVELGIKLKDKNCVPYASDLRIKAEQSKLYTYPDISIICGEIQKSDDLFDTVTNPTVLIEVLSESTKDYDRGTKFLMYRNIPNLQEYILIDSMGAIKVEKYSKNNDGTWQLSDYENISDIIELKSVGIEIVLEDIYRGVYKV
jgi:Uma2 family endonuclease